MTPSSCNKPGVKSEYNVAITNDGKLISLINSRWIRCNPELITSFVCLTKKTEEDVFYLLVG